MATKLNFITTPYTSALKQEMRNLKYTEKPFSECRTESNKTRYVAIDAIRGIAALSVVFYHLYGNIEANVVAWMPAWLGMALGSGNLGIAAFFVISGYVISYSVGTNSISSRFALNFAVRRSIRLDPPYWATIALAISLTYLSYNIFPDIGVRELPSLEKIVAHLFYMQDILEYGNIVSVFWTLCLEFQFYIVFILVILSGRGLVLGKSTLIMLYGLGVWSVMIRMGLVSNPVSGLFLSYWLLFFLGVLLRWSTRDGLSSIWFWSFFCLVLLQGIILSDRPVLAGVATALFFYVLDRMDRLDTTLGQSVFQYLGRISYSLYLIHPVIGWKAISVGKRFAGPELSILEGAALFMAGVLVSVIAAHILYIITERPSVNLAKHFKPDKS